MQENLQNEPRQKTCIFHQKSTDLVAWWSSPDFRKQRDSQCLSHGLERSCFPRILCVNALLVKCRSGPGNDSPKRFARTCRVLRYVDAVFWLLITALGTLPVEDDDINPSCVLIVYSPRCPYSINSKHWVRASQLTVTICLDWNLPIDMLIAPVEDKIQSSKLYFLFLPWSSYLFHAFSVDTNAGVTHSILVE